MVGLTTKARSVSSIANRSHTHRNLRFQISVDSFLIIIHLLSAGANRCGLRSLESIGTLIHHAGKRLDAGGGRVHHASS